MAVNKEDRKTIFSLSVSVSICVGKVTFQTSYPRIIIIVIITIIITIIIIIAIMANFHLYIVNQIYILFFNRYVKLPH